MTTTFLLRERVRRQVLTLEQIKTRVENLRDCRLTVDERLNLPHDPESNNHSLLNRAARLLQWKQAQLEAVEEQRLTQGEAKVAIDHAILMLEASDVA